ncbi:MAG: UDPglucose--hexose-phosphate uridylyltransferase [Gaiellaceae bacterium]|nr:UDPglucose--hexose-phosphate uridylyltransferase [Gaiellaceae bacterium]
MSGELRRDPISGRIVVVAPGRAGRPGAARPALEPPSEDELASCPFCEGREDRTPPETFAVADDAARAPDTPGWRTRVVPNLYPALERQEVVIHSPRHVRSLSELDERALAAIAGAWRARAEAARAEGFPYVHALLNEGREAGASLPHSHSQLAWLRDTPPEPAAERTDSPCGVCAVIARERADGTRILAERDGLLLCAPWAGRVPYELLVVPAEHETGGLASERLPAALELLAWAIRRLHAVEGACPLNAWPHDKGHWHFEVVPRIAVLAGVELGAGIYVNALPPEAAAAALRGEA